MSKAEIIKTRNSIDQILEEGAEDAQMLSEAEIKTLIKGLVTEARRGGKMGMFKMAAAALGGAAALKILSSMFGGDPDFNQAWHDEQEHLFAYTGTPRNSFDRPARWSDEDEHILAANSPPGQFDRSEYR